MEAKSRREEEEAKIKEREQKKEAEFKLLSRASEWI